MPFLCPTSWQIEIFDQTSQFSPLPSCTPPHRRGSLPTAEPNPSSHTLMWKRNKSGKPSPPLTWPPACTRISRFSRSGKCLKDFHCLPVLPVPHQCASTRCCEEGSGPSCSDWSCQSLLGRDSSPTGWRHCSGSRRGSFHLGHRSPLCILHLVFILAFGNRGALITKANALIWLLCQSSRTYLSPRAKG